MKLNNYMIFKTRNKHCVFCKYWQSILESSPELVLTVNFDMLDCISTP